MKKRSIYEAFREQTEMQPEATAIIEESTVTAPDGSSRVTAQHISFAELDRMADAISRMIPADAGNRIGIVMSHSAKMVAAMLAVLKRGAAYVPAEPALPADRRDFMMRDAGATFVITDSLMTGLTGESASPDRSTPSSPAYVLYTSGTSGRPKGVIIRNSSVANYAKAFAAEFHPRPDDVMMQYSVCSFDIFMEEVFASLLNGIAVAIVPEEVKSAGIEAVMQFAGRNRVTIISGFPYLFAEMNRLPSLPPSLRLLISGGDVLRASYIDRLRYKGVEIYNTYGPSETTVCATYQRCDNEEPLPDGTFPIGREVLGTRIRLVDENLKDVKRGCLGEICIYGEGVGEGYTGNPEESVNYMTDEEGNSFFRSGDLGYRMVDGRIVFLRRKDNQVMILGKRVEPLEVENVLNESPDVEHGVVAAYRDKKGLPYLVAYYIPGKAKKSAKAIKKFLASKLADFMVPSYIIALNTIPLTPRGKVDLAALPVPARDR